MHVHLKTSFGTITLELFPEKAPKTVDNFLRYVRDGFYDGTIFHRVIDKFVIQGGGFGPNLTQKPPREPIENESKNGLRNARGTVAMARGSDVNSASSQFFINVIDNDFLNFTAPTQASCGYCVFGQVIDGMQIIDRINGVPTGSKQGFKDVPLNDVLIEKATLAEKVDQH